MNNLNICLSFCTYKHKYFKYYTNLFLILGEHGDKKSQSNNLVGDRQLFSLN